MKYFLISFFFFLYILFYSTISFSQTNSKIDSLEVELKKSVDTSKVNVLNSLASEYRKKNPSKALEYSNQALELSQKNDFKKGIGNSYTTMAAVYFLQGNFEKALNFYYKSLAIRESIGDKPGIAGNLNSIGNVDINQGHYEKGLKNYLKSLEIWELLGDKKSMPLNNIAASYFYLGNYENALKYYLKALKTFEELGNRELMINPLLGVGNVYKAMGDYKNALIYYKQSLAIGSSVKSQSGIAKSLTSIGIIYEKLQNNDTALVYYLESLKINENLGDKSALARSLINIGNIYSSAKSYEKSLEYYQKGLHINEEIGNKDGMAKALLNIGILYSQKNDVEKAMRYLRRGLILADSINSKEIMMEANEELSEVYVKKDDYKNAYTYYKLHAAIKDSLMNENNSKNMAEIQTKYETDKKEKEIELLTKERSLKEAELKTQSVVKNGSIAVSVLLLLFALLAYNRYRIKQKANIEISQKNKEITESISYAKRIQSSFLTSERYISQRLSDYFILYQPRNIVSGDFYWLMEKDNNLYVCTADCTGHGIPGAFMSLISMGILNEIIYSKSHLKHTDEILNELRRIIILAVNPEGAAEEGKDGMDTVLCRFDLKKMELEYSAANNSFYVIRNGELLVFKPDKMPVGKHIGLEKSFTRTVVPLEKGDCIYTFSDGYVDQFGGPKGKKFQSKQLKELFLANCHKPMYMQKEILNKQLQQWKGNCEQVDDILVIGIRV
ncbi:MAG: tetratricopeptide repeat protein [Bacteroidota bacterium]